MRYDQDYYRILGLPPDAEPAQVKQRYRELVRKYHPDVAQDKTLGHQTFVSIQEAYRVLSDPLRRSEYDRRTARKLETPSPSSQSSPGARHTAGSDVERLLSDAQVAFVRKQMSEAERCCRRVLHVQPNNAQAYAILGDIYTAVNRTDDALTQYSYALQHNPNDLEVVRKLTRLREHERRKVERMIRRPRSGSGLRLSLLGVGWALAAYLYVLSIREGPVLDQFAPFSHIPDTVLMPTLAAAALFGLLLGVMQLIGRFDDEMLFTSRGHSLSGGAVPAGLLVPLASIVSFYLAGLLYIIIALGQDRFSDSVAKAFGVVLASTFFFAAPHINSDASGGMLPQMLLWVTGPSFAAFCFGWLVADVLRPHW